MPTRRDRQFRVRTSYVITAAVVATVLARLPLLGLPAWTDEAGFLMVGSGWHLGGSSTGETLYEAYWVDRPPVLIGLYGLADRLGVSKRCVSSEQWRPLSPWCASDGSDTRWAGHRRRSGRP